LSATFALQHKEVFDRQTGAIRGSRAWLFAKLQRMAGITPFQSQANFILVRTAAGRAVSLFEGLKQHGVLIKNLHGSHALLADCLRITVGSEAENSVLVAALESMLRD
jgi:histidinol-phosphate aminotransferase